MVRNIKKLKNINLHPAHITFFSLIILVLIIPTQLPQLLNSWTHFITHHFGLLILCVCSGFVLFAGYITFSRYGKLRLGGKNEKPQFSRFAWLSMLFAAGMGSGLVFNGAAEPLSHLTHPPDIGFQSLAATNQMQMALSTTFFHWCLHAWAIYAIAALSIAYFTFHKHTPMLPSIPVIFSLPKPIQRPVRLLIDTLAIIAVIFGLVATLAKGTLQLSSGLSRILPIQLSDDGLHMAVLGTLVIAYLASAVSGLGKGIKHLSTINVLIAFAFMLFILIAGPTDFIFNAFVDAAQDYLGNFATTSFNTRSSASMPNWFEDWTITYFLWWVAWGPFVGVFIARISRGRSLREFMLGVIIVPCIFSAIWFAVFGGFALKLELFDATNFSAHVDGFESVMFAVLSYLPFETFTTIITVILLFIFLITSADSGTYVLSMFSTGGKLVPVVAERIFWGVAIAITTAALLLSGESFSLFHAVVVLGAIPYLLVMLWQIYGLMKAMRREKF